MALANFYKVKEADFYRLNPLDFKLMSNAELNAIVEQGLIAWDAEKARLRAEARAGKRMTFIAVMAIVTAGAAMAASGATAAAVPGVNAAAAGGSAATVGTTTAAASGAATATTSAGIWSQVQTVAKYIGSVSSIAGKATGSDEANKLAATANIIGAPSWNEAVNMGVNYVMADQGVKIDEKNTNAIAAKNELIARENEAYAANLRKLADERAKQLHVEIKEPEKFSGKELWLLALPVLFGLMNR